MLRRITTLHETSREGILLRQLLDSLAFPCCGSTPIHCDNDTATRLAEDHVLHSEVKHIRVKLHTIWDYIAFGDVRVLRVRSEDNIVDILTKPLGRPDFLRLHSYSIFVFPIFTFSFCFTTLPT